LRALNLNLRLMHVCGTHQDTLVRFGLKEAGIEVRPGPGCPVCVTTAREIEEAIFLARKGKVVATFGDMFRLPSEKWKKKGHINRPIRQRVIVLSLSIKPAFQNLLFRIDYELYQFLVYRFFLFQYLCGITNFNTFTCQGKQSRFTVG